MWLMMVLASPLAEAQDKSRSQGVDLANPISVVQSAGQGIAEMTGRDAGKPAGGAERAAVDFDSADGADGGAGAAGNVHQLHADRGRVWRCCGRRSGTQSLPPSQVVVGLALFMTLLVMGPTLQRSQHGGDRADAGGAGGSA